MKEVYIFETVDDIIKNIPLEVLDRFMVDFKASIIASKSIYESAKELGLEDEVTFTKNLWKDDGIRKITIDLVEK